MWYEQAETDRKSAQAPEEESLIRLKDEAKKCLDSDVANYNIKNAKTNSNFQWMKTVMTKGVVADKIAAYIVMIQDNPVYNLETLSNLVGMVKVGKKKECVIIVEHLVELFLTNLLPLARKLIPFRERPLHDLNTLSSGNGVKRKKVLCYWYFEDQLKETYTQFVRALNVVAHDTVDNNKEKALTAMYKLLAGNPEQEKNLLVNIINKLGDPSRKVASKSIYCLTQLLHQHSNMQGVVLGEIEKLLFRPNVGTRAQYYALCFLSQFYMHHESSDVARRLIEVYFSFFKACVKKGDVNSRMMSALLMGVNRAYPYAKLEMDKIVDHINTMYRVVHIANFNVSLHALSLLYQVSESADLSDRFYSALYRKLLDPHVANSAHQAMLLNLVYKSLKRDTKVERIKVLIKRLLQNAVYMNPSMTCGILYVVSQLLNKRQHLTALILKPPSFVIKREEAEIDDDDDEEKYMDVKDEGETDVANESLNDTDSIVKSSWLHGENITKQKVENIKSSIKGKYDGLSRNPLYAGGEFCAYSELIYLRNHFHPTVALFAQNLLNGETIRYSGDPLKDFSLIKFLDRFVFKNPKQPEALANQGCHPTFGKRKKYMPKGVRNVAVISNSYLNEKQTNIPVEEQFLYTFLQQKNRERGARGNKIDDDEDESDLESVASEEFEDMLDKMTGARKAVDDNVDFMEDIGENLKSKRKEQDELDEDLADVEDDEDLDEMNDDDKELTQFSDDDDNGSDIVFDSDDDLKPKKKKGKDDIASLFASAEEFASILEDEGGSKTAPGGSNTWANKDNANLKQISWEDKRNRWVKGYNDKMNKGGKGFNRNSKRKFAMKNTSQQKKMKVK